MLKTFKEAGEAIKTLNNPSSDYEKQRALETLAEAQSILQEYDSLIQHESPGSKTHDEITAQLHDMKEARDSAFNHATDYQTSISDEEFERLRAEGVQFFLKGSTPIDGIGSFEQSLDSTKQQITTHARHNESSATKSQINTAPIEQKPHHDDFSDKKSEQKLSNPAPLKSEHLIQPTKDFIPLSGNGSSEQSSANTKQQITTHAQHNESSAAKPQTTTTSMSQKPLQEEHKDQKCSGVQNNVSDKKSDTKPSNPATVKSDQSIQSRSKQASACSESFYAPSHTPLRECGHGAIPKKQPISDLIEDIFASKEDKKPKLILCLYLTDCRNQNKAHYNQKSAYRNQNKIYRNQNRVCRNQNYQANHHQNFLKNCSHRIYH